MNAPRPSVVVLAGGVGAARLLRGLLLAMDPAQIMAIVNVADDIELHGLHVSPDLDTITYTLAGQDNTETGWGLTGETWQAMAMLSRYGGVDWFNLGDRDLGTHLYRTHRLGQGATLSEVTREISAAWDIGAIIQPVTDDRIETRVTVADEGEIGFQEYFVRRKHDVPVQGVKFAGAEACRPAPGVLEAISSAEVVIVAPSNPIVSIGPVIAIPGVREALTANSERVAAVSPIIAGKALKGPADRLMAELGLEPTASGVAGLYADFISTFVVDEADAALAPAIEALGMKTVVTNTIMSDSDVAAALCRTILEEMAA